MAAINLFLPVVQRHEHLATIKQKRDSHINTPGSCILISSLRLVWAPPAHSSVKTSTVYFQLFPTLFTLLCHYCYYIIVTPSSSSSSSWVVVPQTKTWCCKIITIWVCAIKQRTVVFTSVSPVHPCSSKRRDSPEGAVVPASAKYNAYRGCNLAAAEILLLTTFLKSDGSCQVAARAFPRSRAACKTRSNLI